jgi:hypothetical protein
MYQYCLFVCSLLTLVGCGSAPQDGSQPIQGKVTVNGATITVAGRNEGLGWVNVQFYLLDANSKPSETPTSVAVNEQGAFHIKSHNGNGKQGLMPGKYLLALEVEDNGQKKYLEFSRAKSKKQLEIKPNESELTIDFGK